jgi:hypothetical protein
MFSMAVAPSSERRSAGRPNGMGGAIECVLHGDEYELNEVINMRQRVTNALRMEILEDRASEARRMRVEGRTRVASRRRELAEANKQLHCILLAKHDSEYEGLGGKGPKRKYLHPFAGIGHEPHRGATGTSGYAVCTIHGAVVLPPLLPVSRAHDASIVAKPTGAVKLPQITPFRSRGGLGGPKEAGVSLFDEPPVTVENLLT